MKKLIKILTLSCLFSLGVQSFAQAKEILFRDIPWGANFEEVKSKIPNIEFKGNEYEHNTIYDIDYVAFQKYNSMNLKHSSIICNYFTEEGSIEVAGYEVDDVRLFFVNELSEESPELNNDEAKLFCARYDFKTDDVKATEKDLLGKLTYLYGKPDYETTRESDVFFYEKFHIWYGDNETELIMRSADYYSDYTLYHDKVILTYAWRKGDEILKASDEFMQRKIVEDGIENNGEGFIDGL